jgi:hypothetical protein
MRHDLLALTEDDLITQSNRGIVKRQAEKDLETLSYELTEAEDGTVTVVWSDGETVILPPDKTLLQITQQGNISADKLSRQIVRSVMAYQQWIATAPKDEASPLPQAAVWNPAEIREDALLAHYGKAKLNAIRREFDAGHVFELVRSVKPTARFHTASVTVRFLVPMDFRYTHCDCEEAMPCRHVPMAVWAFRLLSEDKASGLIESLHENAPIPENLIAEIRNSLLDLAELGLAGANEKLMQRFERLAARSDSEGLIWIAEILRDLLLLQQQYQSQDAQFSPLRLAEILAELIIRLKAIEKQSPNIPGLFVRGSQNDRETKIGSSSLIGLGCGVDIQKKGVMLSAYMQDSGSGQVFAVQKYYADPDDKTADARSFAGLGKNKAMKDSSFQSVGCQRLLIKGGKRFPNASFGATRAQISANPQSFQWENLRAPLLAEDFTEILARRSAQPPKSLRPRRIGEDFFVCPIESIEFAAFDSFSQSVVAVLSDKTANQANLLHPFTSRGAQGAEKLLWWLTKHPQAIRFIAGQISIRQGGLLIAPIALIFELDGQRHSVQPWVDTYEGEAGTGFSGDSTPRLTEPIHYYPSQVLEKLGETFTLGFSRLDDAAIRNWEQLLREGETLGFDRLLSPIASLVQILQTKRTSMKWDWQSASSHAFESLLLLQFAREMS